MWLGVDYFDNDALDAVDDKAVDLNPGDAHHEESGESSPSEGEQESHKDCQHLPESEHEDCYALDYVELCDVYGNGSTCQLAWGHSILLRPKRPE